MCPLNDYCSCHEDDEAERQRPTIKTNNPQVARPWPYDGADGRARLTGSLDTGGSFTGDDGDEGDDYYRQSTTACCPRQTIPDSCSCMEGCECMCTDCDCGNWGEEYEDD